MNTRDIDLDALSIGDPDSLCRIDRRQHRPQFLVPICHHRADLETAQPTEGETMTEPFGTELLADPDAIPDPDEGILPPHQAAIVGILTHRYPDLPAHDLIETSAAVVYALDKAGLLGTDRLSIEQSTRMHVFDRLSKDPFEENDEFIGALDQIVAWILAGEKPKGEDADGEPPTVVQLWAIADEAVAEVTNMLAGVDDSVTFVSVHSAALRRVLAALRAMSAPPV